MNFSDEIISHIHLTDIKLNPKGTPTDLEFTYAKSGVYQKEIDWIREKAKATGIFNITEEINEEYMSADITRAQIIYEQLVERVKLGEDYNDLADALLPSTDLQRIQEETLAMSKIWANNLLASADENAQSVIEAVNQYYQGELERIAESIDYEYSTSSSVTAKTAKLNTTLDIDAKITKPSDDLADVLGEVVGNRDRPAVGES